MQFIVIPRTLLFRRWSLTPLYSQSILSLHDRVWYILNLNQLCCYNKSKSEQISWKNDWLTNMKKWLIFSNTLFIYCFKWLDPVKTDYGRNNWLSKQTTFQFFKNLCTYDWFITKKCDWLFLCSHIVIREWINSCCSYFNTNNEITSVTEYESKVFIGV